MFRASLCTAQDVSREDTPTLALTLTLSLAQDVTLEDYALTDPVATVSGAMRRKRVTYPDVTIFPVTLIGELA